ncbi:hypothetical protein C8R45DRAFT_1006605 [Mycena sanguinolenta]|nr:hypothetical protein C8R45DRAFT_1006605 [Mycena sanguinolenta]
MGHLGTQNWPPRWSRHVNGQCWEVSDSHWHLLAWPFKYSLHKCFPPGKPPSPQPGFSSARHALCASNLLARCSSIDQWRVAGRSCVSDLLVFSFLLLFYTLFFGCLPHRLRSVDSVAVWYYAHGSLFQFPRNSGRSGFRTGVNRFVRAWLWLRVRILHN